jgi:tight adherence protein B
VQLALLGAAAALGGVALGSNAPGALGRRRLPRLPSPIARRLQARRRRRRERDIEDQLHVIVAELAGQLRAGRSISQAMEAAALELSAPASDALALAANRAALGMPAWDALGELGDAADIRLVAAVVRVQATAGGDLVELLNGLAEVLVERRGLRRMAAVATAQASTTGHIVTGMPVLGLAALWLLDHGAVTALLQSPIGWAALLLSAAVAALGNLMIRRLAAVEP